MNHPKCNLDRHNLRYIISSVAIFGAFWSLFAMIITSLWYVFPFCDLEIMRIARWPIALIILLLL